MAVACSLLRAYGYECRRCTVSLLVRVESVGRRSTRLPFSYGKSIALLVWVIVRVDRGRSSTVDRCRRILQQ
eukprot:scaffold295259_cov42-Prasinocladus_malaysianus.AAC.1